MSHVLEVRHARKAYGALCVTDDVSLTIDQGELHALIGPNGAGKSSLIGAISGELWLDAGEILFDGQPVDKLPMHRRARAGIARAFQVPQIFSSLTVGENLSVVDTVQSGTSWKWHSSVAGNEAEQAEQLRQVSLSGMSDRCAATLAHGERRQLELAVAFAGGPKLLLLDEPLAGLGPADAARTVELLRKLKGRYAMLVVEHDVEAVFALADRISVLVSGKIVACGPPDEIRRNEIVRSAYLGEALA